MRTIREDNCSVEITSRQQQTQRTLLGWLRVEYGIEKPSNELLTATELASDAWARSKKLKPETGGRKAKIGNVENLINAPRSTTVGAVEPTDCVVIRQSDFQNLIAGKKEIECKSYIYRLEGQTCRTH